MADFTQTIDYPSFSLGEVDVRQAFRNVVGSRMRRGMQRIADDAANNTPFPHIAEAYRVTQETVGDLLTFDIVNDDAHWPFVEYDMPRHEVPPVLAPIQPFIEWVDYNALELSPFAVHAKVAAVGFTHPGTHGRHMLEEAFDSGVMQLEASIEEGLDLLAETWGKV